MASLIILDLTEQLIVSLGRDISEQSEVSRDLFSALLRNNFRP